MQNEKTVQELLNEQNEEGMCFLVPHYQRGYRWQRANVLDLLYDISDFIHSDKKILFTSASCSISFRKR